MANYKTPGVYVEEITKFPPSVAQVETAIPAFIGYTEKAEKLNGDSLHLIPTRITSMLDFETYFGLASPEDSIVVELTDVLNDSNEVSSRNIKVHQPSSKSPFLMYYSMQLYFANGGGPCYIASVGQYGSNPTRSAVNVIQGELVEGLTKIGKEDEPTLLVFPDATSLGAGDFYGIYDRAISQCAKLQDRFTIHDLRFADGTAGPITEFRGNVTSETDKAKYCAAYYPFLETILNYRYKESDVIINHYSTNADAYDQIEQNLAQFGAISGIVTSLFDMSPNAAPTVPGNVDITGLVSDALVYLYDDLDLAGAGPFAMSGAQKTDFLTIIETLNSNLGNLINLKSKLKIEAKAASSTVKDEDAPLAGLIDGKLATLLADFEGANKLESIHTNLQDLYIKLQKSTTLAKDLKILDTEATNFDDELKKMLVFTPLDEVSDIAVPTVNLFEEIVANSTDLINEIKNVDGKDKNNGKFNGRSLASLVSEDNTVYNKIKVEIDALPLTLPPSSAMAGIYARIDSSKGVWKAPANVGLSYVIKPTVQISHEEQGDLNVHITGKSINAIRTFTGKGTLVWGARTLAGNDNEWRYVPVRRFFNMVEESVSKATEQFVFEGNDANTWVRVRAMIENFLILQWKAGALTGAKAEQAFYVRVGLGQTMTAQDILEGRMIVEIGMAVVRPAEFIILRFSHKMQEA